MINCPISLSKVAWKKKENLVSQSIKLLCGQAFSCNAGIKISGFSGNLLNLLGVWNREGVTVIKISL